MLALRLLAMLLSAYLLYLGIGMVARIDPDLVIGPRGSVPNRIIRPVLAVYLDVLGVRIGGIGAILVGLWIGIPAVRGARKPRPNPTTDEAQSPGANPDVPPIPVDSGDGR